MTRFMMIGGFLGAGKTTAILRLARGHAEAGRRVGIIANDLGEGLVDTETYRAHGLPVEEMAGVCFACRFDELIEAAGRLRDGHKPDVLLAEPAGSCTDLVSRVIKPLKELYADRFTVAPYVALLDPQRAFKALTGKGPGGLSTKVLYLYKMQQNEADVVAINKIDTLEPERLEELTALVSRNFPKAEVLGVSARTGEGFDRLEAALDCKRPSGLNAIDPSEYDGPAAAEANERLAWLNASWAVGAPESFDGDELLLDLGAAIQQGLAGVEAEPAHVKMILQSGDDLGIANLLSSDRAVELSRSCGRRMTEATLIINCRVEVELSVLREQVDNALRSTLNKHRVDSICESVHEQDVGYRTSRVATAQGP
jgi:G3E family GTPase